MMYDAFLSYNTKDRATVEAIALYLKDKAGLKVFFDRWEMIPGSRVQETLERALVESAACVVFIGPSGLGIYQNEETRIALEKSISKKELRVIPVLLPGGKRETKESELPPFLRRLSWVEFGDNPLDADSLRRLECGIKNLSPGPGEKPLDQPTGICPYRGLEVFREQDRPFFFGRESLVQRLITRLKSDRFLAFIGPSGSGKSSVLQAGMIPLLRSDSLIALFTPRERPLEELALALRRAAATNQLPYSTAQMVDQFNHSAESLHYLAREILQALPVDGSKPVQRFVVIVDQFEEIFTLSRSEPERQQFISLLLRAVEMVGGPVTVILAMRSDFIGKCTPYRDLNIYCSEHLEQVEPMTRFDLQSAIEKPAHAVGLEFDPGLVGLMLEDVKGSGSELPLIGHALWELYHYQPRPSNRLTVQAYEAIGRIEGALVRRAESLYNGLTVSQQETLRKMFLLGLIQPGEGAPDTRRRALKEELLAIGDDAPAVEKLIYELATARLLTVGRDEAAGQDTVEVAHEALIRNWGRIAEWMAEGREMARQRGLLRQAAREWEKSGKNPEYLFHGTRLAQMEEFVTLHGQDLGSLEKEFIAFGTAERETQRRRKRRNTQVIIGALIAVLLVVTYLAYRADRNEKKAIKNEKEAIKQLAVNYWDTARKMREDNDHLKSLYLFCEALTIEKDKRFREVLLTDMNGLWRTMPLLHIFPHKKVIKRARFSKDGTRILTWNANGTVRLWDVATGNPIGGVMKHDDVVHGVIFNRNETFILTWSDDKTARVWDAATGKPSGEVMKHEAMLNGAIFNENETRILTWSADKTARIWDAATGKPIGEIMKHEGKVNGAIFNKNDSLIFTWSDDNTIRLWDADTGNPIGEVIKHDGPAEGAIFNQNETRILTWNFNKTARLWDAVARKPIGEVMKHDGRVGGAIFNQDDTRILTWSGSYFSRDHSARLWDAATGKPIGEAMKHDGWVLGAIFNKNKSRILTWSDDKTARLWDPATGKPIGVSMKHETGLIEAIFNQDDTRVLTCGADGTIRSWDATTCKSVGLVMEHEHKLNGAIFNNNETRILTWGYDDTARVWDAATGNPVGKVMKHEGIVWKAFFNKDDTRILTWSSDNTDRLWDADTGKPVGEVIKHDNVVNGAIYNKNNTCVISWNSDDTAQLWDTVIGKPIGLVMGHDHQVNGAAFNHNEIRIITWNEDKTARLWDAATGKPIGEAMKNVGRVNHAIFNQGGNRIIILRGEYDKKNGTARLWDVATGKPIGQVMKHDHILCGATFNKVETQILTWSHDGTARLWEAATGKPIGEVMKHDNLVEGAIFNKDETRILTWSLDGTARLWETATGKPIGEIMTHGEGVNGAVFNRSETLILTWSGEDHINGTARLWDAATGKPNGEIMKHKNEVKGAIFNKDETRILTWSKDCTARLWDIAIDPDFPMEYIKLQAQAITGTSYDTNTNTVKVLSPEEWRKIKEHYMKIAARHYKSCRFPEGNMFRRLFPVKAQKVRPGVNHN